MKEVNNCIINKMIKMNSATLIRKPDGNGDSYAALQGQFKEGVLDYPVIGHTLPDTLRYFQEEFQAKDDDVWLLTVPKSGTHWMYEMISILQSGVLQPAKGYLEEMMLEGHDSDYFRQIDSIPTPHVFNTHINIRHLPGSIMEKSKVIYLLRNPKSCAYSFYHMHKQHKFLDYDGEFSGYLKTFSSALGQYSLYGNWFSHITEAWNHLHLNPKALFVFYEELILNPVDGIHQLARFLGLERSGDFCRSVADITSFEKMKTSYNFGKPDADIKKMESKWKNNERVLFRRGKIDDWKNHFTMKQSEQFDALYVDEIKAYPELLKRIQFQ